MIMRDLLFIESKYHLKSDDITMNNIICTLLKSNKINEESYELKC